MAAGRNASPARLSAARARVLAVLGEAVGPWTVEEVADRLGISPATARKHLDELARSGAVVADSERTGRPGRPRLHYRAGTGAGPADAYQRLARSLLTVIASGEAPQEVGRQLGARLRPAVIDGTDRAAAEQALLGAMAAEGFEPELVDGPDGAVMTFHRCPYAAAATDQPGIVCALHHGFAAGLLDGDGAAEAPGGHDDEPGAGDGAAPSVGRLEVRDPRVAGCRLHLRAPG